MKVTLSQILVHVDGSDADHRRLKLALDLAAIHGSAVSALHAVSPAFMGLPFAPDIGAAAAQSLQELDARRRDSARAAFDSLAARPGVHAAWSEVCEAPVADAFAAQALYADLMVLGQHQAGSDTGVPADFAESVIAQSGRPALILPWVADGAALAQTIVIAWKPTREAARAVTAALPLLQRAQRVHVLSWGAPAAAVTGAALDLPGMLHLRGIEAQWHACGPEPSDLGDALLSRACDLGADLLVMGCYGHSRAREWVLGGTSRTVLRSMTLPVLAAH